MLQRVPVGRPYHMTVGAVLAAVLDIENCSRRLETKVLAEVEAADVAPYGAETVCGCIPQMGCHTLSTTSLACGDVRVTTLCMRPPRSFPFSSQLYIREIRESIQRGKMHLHTHL